jgi:hypothetical protein
MAKQIRQRSNLVQGALDYRLAEKGRKQLVAEESQWKQMTEAAACVIWPTVEES